MAASNKCKTSGSTGALPDKKSSFWCQAMPANAEPMLGQHRRRWTKIEPTLDTCLKLVVVYNKIQELHQVWHSEDISWQSVCYLKSSTCILMLASCLRLPSPPPSNAMLAIFFCSSLLQITTSNMLTLQQYIVPLGYDRVYLPYTLSYQRWYIYIFKV